MGPKPKSSGVSTSSFFDLRAEIAKHEEEFAKNKAAGKGKYVVGGVKRPDKKPTIWGRQNKGVGSRSARDIELEAISQPTLENARAVLERKAKVYDKLKKGKSGGLTDKQYGSLLVDFDQKPIDAFESDSDDVDESLTVPKPPGEANGFVCTTNEDTNDEDDPVIEYEDEFGRARSARRSEVPRHLLPSEHKDDPPEEDIDPYVIYNPVNHFPIYEPSADRVAEIAAEYAEETNPLNVHYDASQEVRAKGAGFYQFSGDEETRRKQMEELRKARMDTEKTREHTGAVDLRPGEVEGMVAPAESVGGSGLKSSRAMEKRKREIEERRKMLEAKRRKKNPGTESSGSSAKPTPPPASITVSTPPDPFAALEAQASQAKPPNVSSKGKQKGSSTLPPQAQSDADAFLAALERDVLKRAPR